jgi:hypothetical protein
VLPAQCGQLIGIIGCGIHVGREEKEQEAVERELQAKRAAKYEARRKQVGGLDNKGGNDNDRMIMIVVLMLR